LAQAEKKLDLIFVRKKKGRKKGGRGGGIGVREP